MPSVKLDLVLPVAVNPAPSDLLRSLALVLASKLQNHTQVSAHSADDLISKKSPLYQTILAAHCADHLPVLIVDGEMVLFQFESIVGYLSKCNCLPLDKRAKVGRLLGLLVRAGSQEDLNKVISEFDRLYGDWIEDADYAGVRSLLFASLLDFSSRAIASDLQVSEKLKLWFHAQMGDKKWAKAIQDTVGYCTVKDSVKLSKSLKLASGLKKEVLPVANEKNILITSALPYVNNVPHLGNIIGCVLSADVYARYCRLRGLNTLYICGTDEYGTATETKALAENLTCQQICDKYHAIHADVYKWFDIEFDYFGRTSTPKHTKISQDMFLKLNEKGLLIKQTVEQLFSEKLGKFLADRFVEGTCPFCQYPDARGDQCDGCGKTFDSPTDLINPRCKLTGTTPILKNSEHMYLDLTKLQPKCEAWVNEASEAGFWSTNGKGITSGWFKEGLLPRCITRDLEWGTPVPLAEMAKKVLYVWFDAPIGYLSITANYTNEWEKWWKNPDQVQLYQFMGKDNVPFHTVIFPCTLLGTEEKYTMLHHLSTTEYLQYEGDKFSKSRGIGVFGNNVMESGIPVEVWRYYLLMSRPENSDSVFSWTDLGQRNNSELLANIGNFMNRILKFLKAKYASCVPEATLDEKDNVFIADIDKILNEYIRTLDAVKIRHGLLVIMEMSSRANAYVNDSHFDNTLFDKEPKKCATVMNVCVNVIYLLSAVMEPYMPSTTASILRQINAPRRQIPDSFSLDIMSGHRLGNPELLFKRIDEKTCQGLFMKYGGAAILEKRQKAAAGELVQEKKKRHDAADKKKPVTDVNGDDTK